MSEQMDEARLEELAGKVMGDIAGSLGMLLAYIGDQTGVYAALDESGPSTAAELAEKLGFNEKYIHEWLASNAAGGYVDYDQGTGKFSLSPEQALLFTREGQPMCLQGFIQNIVAQFETHEKAVDTFRSGKGRPWSDHVACCFCGTDRFFRPQYDANLLESWLPALDGVEEKLRAGAKIADIGCGHGSSSILMAKAFPNSTVYGFDYHAPSIESARAKAEEEGVNNVEFHVASAQDFDGRAFDFACIFDALHDMGDPVGAARHIRETLKSDGTFMLVEPMAGDTLTENLHPMGQAFYGFSTVVCTPCSLSQDVGLGLGTQAGQKRLTEVLNEAGFKNVRRAAETPTNMVLEVTG